MQLRLLAIKVFLASLAVTQVRAESSVLRAENVLPIAQLLQEGYAHTDVAQRYAQTLRQHLANGRYCRIKDETTFADKLTSDPQSVYSDRHLKVRYSVDPLPADDARWNLESEAKEVQKHQAQLRDNVSF